MTNKLNEYEIWDIKEDLIQFASNAYSNEEKMKAIISITDIRRTKGERFAKENSESLPDHVMSIIDLKAAFGAEMKSRKAASFPVEDNDARYIRISLFDLIGVLATQKSGHVVTPGIRMLNEAILKAWLM